MNKIGREVLFLAADETATRNGEGSFIRLKDGGIMLTYTEFFGESHRDSGEARFVATVSRDEGETWGEKRVIVTKAEYAMNIMSTSLVRMNNGDIGLLYLQKYIKDRIVYDEILLRRSSDEGLTWSEPTVCNVRDSYYCPANGRALRLKNGRIILAVAEYGRRLGEPGTGETGTDNIYSPGSILCLFSDDDGITWQESQSKLPPLFQDDTHEGFSLTEPCLYERETGELYMYIRTDLRMQYETVSTDGGNTWTSPRPNLLFASGSSPMLVQKFGAKTLAIWNPVPKPSPFMFAEYPIFDRSNRTPLLCAVSEDDGQTYGWACFIEDDITNNFCYPAAIEADGYLLVCYYHSNDSEYTLNSLKVTKIRYDELENPLASN